MVEEDAPRLARIQRVLAQDEGARRGGRPGVDPGGLDQVEALGRAREPAPRFIVHEAHARHAVQVPGELGEASVHRVEGDTVELERHHFGRLEQQRREHVAAAAGPDHRGLRARPQVVREVDDVEAQVVDLAQVALELREQRAGAGIDDQPGERHLPLGAELRAHAPAERVGGLVGMHGDAGEGVPALVDRRHLVADLGPADGEQRFLAVRGDIVQRRQGAQQRGEAGGRRAQPARLRRRPDERGTQREGADREYRAHPVHHREQQDERDAAERGAREIDGVQPTHRARVARQGEADADAGEHERRRDEEVGDREPVLARRAQREVDEHRDHQGRAEGRGRDGHRRARALLWEPARHQVDGERAGGHAEHRHRHRDEREVIPEGDAEDPCQQDLGHQRGERDEEQAAIDGGAGGGRGAGRSGVRGHQVRAQPSERCTASRQRPSSACASPRGMRGSKRRSSFHWRAISSRDFHRLTVRPAR